MTRNRITAMLIATLALGAAAPAASAEEQKALSQEQQYAYNCGHLGTSCGRDDAAPARKNRARRACGTRQRRAAKRAGRKAERRYTRRCGGRKTRRAGARR